MKAIYIEKHGSIAGLKISDIPCRSPCPTEIE
jgi:hypothetical protein